MTFSTQPTLQNERVILLPLKESDYADLYNAASDPKIWEQHPNRNRWKEEEFQNYFRGALLSKGAFKILDKETNAVIGSTRFYDYNSVDDSIRIGYTFFATRCWGTGLNPVVKTLLIDYIFQFVSKVYFDIGSGNIRSQIAISRLGAQKVGEQMVNYYGETANANFIYEIKKEDWLNRF
jgi:N-acetyltransferase